MSRTAARVFRKVEMLGKARSAESEAFVFYPRATGVGFAAGSS